MTKLTPTQKKRKQHSWFENFERCMGIWRMGTSKGKTKKFSNKAACHKCGSTRDDNQVGLGQFQVDLIYISGHLPQTQTEPDSNFRSEIITQTRPYRFRVDLKPAQNDLK